MDIGANEESGEAMEEAGEYKPTAEFPIEHGVKKANDSAGKENRDLIREGEAQSVPELRPPSTQALAGKKSPTSSERNKKLLEIQVEESMKHMPVLQL